MEANNNKTEKEIYLEAVVPYMTTFINEVQDHNAHVVERTVAQMKQKFALDDAQEAALQIVLFNLETMYNFSCEDLNFDGFFGLNINIVVDIVMKDYRHICDHRLAEPYRPYMDEEEDDEENIAEKEYYDSKRMLLIKYYGTCIGKGDDDPVTDDDVLDSFFVYAEAEDDAKKVLADFRKKMDEARENGISQEDMAVLLDDTIDDLDEYNIHLQ